jgi:glutamyl-tRNA synthetase
MKEVILRQVLKNAYDFDGSVNPKVVLGLTLRDNQELKKDVPAVMKEINNVIAEIKGLSKEEIKTKLKEVAPELLEKKKEEKKIEGPLKPLPNAEKGKVVVRIAPSPSGPLHIGHAYGYSLNYEYAKMYEGEFIVRIEDTNPENIYTPGYEMIENDSNWLTENNVSKMIIQSSRLGIYYDHAEKLVRMGKAYVCTCDLDKWREMKSKGEACICRDLEIKEQQTRYAKMFNGYAEGEAVLKLKTDIQHKNPAMRDFSIMRINEHVHPKTGKEQRVWPLMVLSVAVDDHEFGITHVMNGKEHADNAAKEKIIMEYFGWNVPEYKHWGKINFEGFKLKTSTTKLKIEQKEYSGWDDIRLPFLPALRRRGYQARAFRKYATEIGLSLTDKKVTMEEFWKNINSFNRELIEDKANRYFFVQDPVKINISGAPKKEVKIDLHPSDEKRGKRTLNVTSNTIYLAEDDTNNLEEKKIHRLMDYCNFIVENGKYKLVSESYEEFKSADNKGMIIHWLPEDNNIVVEVMLDNGETVLGLGEQDMKKLQEEDLVQLERNYYARTDNVEKGKITFYYLHK